MNIKKLLSPIFVASLSMVISAQAFAANRVFWDGRAISAIAERKAGNYELADTSALSEIGSYVDMKLKAVPLPFELGLRDSQLKNANIDAFSADEEQFALIPIVLDDSVSESWYEADNEKFYKYIVRTNINIMLCGYGGKMQNRVNFLYNIPLNGYGVVRTKAPATKEQLRKQFLSNAQQIINKRLNVPANIVDFMDPTYGKTKIYQVQNVSVDPKMGKVQDLNDMMGDIVSNIANSYTGAYAAAHPEFVVLPDKLKGEAWQKAVVKHIDANLSASEIDDEVGARAINLEIFDYSLQKVKDPTRTKDASFFDKYVLRVGLRDLTSKKSVQPVKEYQLPNNIPARAEISPENFYGHAARLLARGK